MPRDGFEPDNQFRKGKGHDKIVISAAAQGGKAILGRVTSRQNDDRNVSMAFTQVAQKRGGLSVRQPQVEDDGHVLAVR